MLGIKIVSDQSTNILEEECLCLLSLNDTRDIMKQSSAGIIKAPLLTSLTERLARKACTHDITTIHTLTDMLSPLFLGQRSGG